MTGAWRRKLLLVFAAALLVRAAYSAAFPPGALVNDARGYDVIGWNLASGAGFSLEPGVPTPVRAPLFPALLAAVYAVFGHHPALGALAQALLGALACLLVFDIAARLWDRRTALLAAWLAALMPVSVVYSGLLLSETLFTALFLLSLAAFLRSEGGGRAGWLAASGAALALATLTRPTTILFPGAAALALLIGGGRRPAAAILLFLLAFALVIAPWTARNYKRFGVLLPVATGGATCLYATGVEAEGGTYGQGFAEIAEKWKAFAASPDFRGGLDPDIRFDRELKAEGLAKIKAHPAGYAAVALKRMPKYWFSSHSSVFGVDKPLGEYRAEGRWLPIAARGALAAFHAAVVLLAGLGMWLSRRTFRAWSILLLVFVYFNMHALFDICPRYFVPIFPYLLMFCAAAVYGLKDRAAGKGRP